ncbi:hypothetical protein [Corynebacterium uterequi]|uniref:Uncharacterized protein n=1 Tax=Corynebacterium uterequi TaxID=1072256 RepID=A0A0G3HEP4_9CORY|nr:hypothetical protein [Corynebacterium uterequi]AKK10443.1 hypothetical protein CUTER_02140 [Corynebacterium uterequi]
MDRKNEEIARSEGLLNALGQGIDPTGGTDPLAAMLLELRREAHEGTAPRRETSVVVPLRARRGACRRIPAAVGHGLIGAAAATAVIALGGLTMNYSGMLAPAGPESVRVELASALDDLEAATLAGDAEEAQALLSHIRGLLTEIRSPLSWEWPDLAPLTSAHPPAQEPESAPAPAPETTSEPEATPEPKAAKLPAKEPEPTVISAWIDPGQVLLSDVDLSPQQPIGVEVEEDSPLNTERAADIMTSEWAAVPSTVLAPSTVITPVEPTAVAPVEPASPSAAPVAADPVDAGTATAAPVVADASADAGAE